MMFTDIEEAISWITSIRNKDYSFENFKQLCEELENPQDGFYTVHIAGTDGKGSTVNYLRALLMSQGFRVGTFTSPHYVTHLDRIRIDDVNISDEAFLRILNQNLDLFRRHSLSMFEMDYLIMCQYFKEEKVDYALIEVGLGGRLDCTNAVNDTKLSIITTIGYDHMERLGNTLEQICKEKCGIIKDDSQVLIGDLSNSCKEIVRQTAARHHSRYYEKESYVDLGERRFRFNGREYELGSYADYQKHNASLALQALDIIAEDCGFMIDRQKAKDALKKAIWHCRFEIVKEKPRVILDGAHNIHGVEALTESFDRFSGSKCIIFSALKRKEYRKMADLLKKHTDRLIITTFSNSEVIDLNEFRDYDTEPDYRKAIGEAMKFYDNILICGSLYFMSEVVLNCKF
ncbi:MAG: bifunctional folylpolyglutamate synthase/dihydrofolate synthase [Erysipelotrichaceae bacterium]|nr:bifunctional folylpolyglutamate synthase/dihydrofolate synthase [Erysipelotrichaceae bacterium]